MSSTKSEMSIVVKLLFLTSKLRDMYPLSVSINRINHPISNPVAADRPVVSSADVPVPSRPLTLNLTRNAIQSLMVC
jgi:hypothetical protein